MALGQLASGDFVDAQLRAMQAAIVEQEIDGIDVITGGEMHRRSLVLSDKSEPVQQLQLKELVPQQVEMETSAQCFQRGVACGRSQKIAISY